MATIQLSTIPPIPSPGDKDFETKIGRVLSHMPTLASELKTIAETVVESATLVDVEGNATVAATAASQASLSAGSAVAAAGTAATQANAAKAEATKAARAKSDAALAASQSGTNAVAAMQARDTILDSVNEINQYLTELEDLQQQISSDAQTVQTALSELTDEPLVSQSDIGRAPNQIPLNQFLGLLAYRDTVTVLAPASSTSPGNKGDVAQDASYLYICIAKDSWKRVAVAAW